MDTERDLKKQFKVPSYQKKGGPSLEVEMPPDNFKIVQKVSEAELKLKNAEAVDRAEKAH